VKTTLAIAEQYRRCDFLWVLYPRAVWDQQKVGNAVAVDIADGNTPRDGTSIEGRTGRCLEAAFAITQQHAHCI
jgi:hypothetical protein